MVKTIERQKIKLALITKSTAGDTSVTDLKVGDKFKPYDFKDCVYMEVIEILKETAKMVHFKMEWEGICSGKTFKQSYRKTSTVNLIY